MFEILSSCVTGKTVTMISQFGAQEGLYLVDGVYSGGISAGTDIEPTPWMQIDLGQIQCVAAVEMYQKLDCK